MAKTILTLKQLCNEMKRRYPLGKAYPWSATDFKKQNPDIDFSKSSKNVNEQYVDVAGEEIWVSKWEYFIFIMRGHPFYFDEVQFEYYVQTIKELRPNQPEFFYQVEYGAGTSSLPHKAAGMFCQQKYDKRLAQVLYERGCIRSDYDLRDAIIRTQLNLPKPKLKYDSKKIELPPLIGYEDYKNECETLSDQTYKIHQMFTTCCFKGISEDINELIFFLKQFECSFYRNDCDIEGLEEVHIQGNDLFEQNIIEQAIRDFPQLKFIGFFQKSEGWQVYVVFSETGYDHITDAQFVGHYDGKNENSWHYSESPTEAFEIRDVYIAVGEEYSVNYNFPFSKKWNSLNFVKNIKGETYTLFDSKIMEKELCEYQKAIQKLPVYFYVDAWKEYTEKLTVGEELKLKVNKGNGDIEVYVKDSNKREWECGKLGSVFGEDDSSIIKPITNVIRNISVYKATVAEIVRVSERAAQARHPHLIVKIEKR